MRKRLTKEESEKFDEKVKCDLKRLKEIIRQSKEERGVPKPRRLIDSYKKFITPNLNRLPSLQKVPLRKKKKFTLTKLQKKRRYKASLKYRVMEQRIREKNSVKPYHGREVPKRFSGEYIFPETYKLRIEEGNKENEEKKNVLDDILEKEEFKFDKHRPEYLQIDDSRIPIDLFDFFDEKTHLSELLNESTEGKELIDLLNQLVSTFPEAESSFYENGRWFWKKCLVKKIMKIELESGISVFRYVTIIDGKEKKVRRLNLRFLCEAKRDFYERLRTAYSLKKLSKELVRFEYFIEKQKVDQDEYKISEKIWENIVELGFVNVERSLKLLSKEKGKIQVDDLDHEMYQFLFERVGRSLDFYFKEISLCFQYVAQKTLVKECLCNRLMSFESRTRKIEAKVIRDLWTKRCCLALKIDPSTIERFKKLYPKIARIRKFGKIYAGSSQVAGKEYKTAKMNIQKKHFSRSAGLVRSLSWLNREYESIQRNFSYFSLASELALVFQDPLITQEYKVEGIIEKEKSFIATQINRVQNILLDPLIDVITDNLGKKYNFYNNTLDKRTSRLLRRFNIQIKIFFYNLMLQSLNFVQKHLSTVQDKQNSFFLTNLVQSDGKLIMSPGEKRFVSTFDKLLLYLQQSLTSLVRIDSKILPLQDIKPVPYINLQQTISNDTIVSQLKSLMQNSSKVVSKIVAQRFANSTEVFGLFSERCIGILKVEEAGVFVKSFATDLIKEQENTIKNLEEQFKLEEEKNKEREEEAGKEKDDSEDEESDEEKEDPETKLKEEIKLTKNEFIEKYRVKIRSLWSLYAEICNRVENYMSYGPVVVGIRDFKDMMKTKVTSYIDAFHTSILKSQVRTAQYCSSEFENILNRISKKPQNEEQLLALDGYVAGVQVRLEDLIGVSDQVHKFLNILENETKGEVGYVDFELFWNLKFFPQRIRDLEEQIRKELEQDKIQMIARLAAEKANFQTELEKIGSLVSDFERHDNYENLQGVVVEMNLLDERIQNAMERVDNFNMRDRALGFSLNTYSELQAAKTNYEPFRKLWTMSNDFKSLTKEWLNGPLNQLDGQAVTDMVNEWWALSYRLAKTLESTNPGAAEVAIKLREDSTSFKKYLPLITTLASPALRDRHWALLSELLKEEVYPDDSLTLQGLLDLDVMGKFEEVEIVAVKAEKEFQLEQNVEAMRQEWSETSFDLMEYKNTRTYVLKGTDEIMTLLDDHIVKVQTMLGSPFIRPIISVAKSWEQSLQYIQTLVDEVLKCQRAWMYLEPIFQSPDIMRQMPTEARRFKAVDQTWRKTLNAINLIPSVMITIQDDTLVKRFQQCNEKLDLIQKGLNDYLEIKRMSFARFFFLSNEELLEIVSQTKDPEAVQPFLNKCFEGINLVIFARDDTDSESAELGDLTIVKMKSGEGEIVKLSFPIDTENSKNKGNVELWLGELELSMRITVKELLEKAMLDYPTLPAELTNNQDRKKWVLAWPGQVVLNASQLFWTQEVNQAIEEKKLVVYVESLNAQLLQIVHLVRGDLSKMERTTLGALSVIDLHQRDVIAEIRDDNVTDTNSFEWLSQLRYYWEEQPDDFNRYGKNPWNLMVRILNATQMYSYEYLGNSSRLVITPLTDRCYRTLMGAVSLLYGGAPAGPAGTGKTETTKDLAKAIAKHCVVFNCSDGLDYLAMAKFFKGLAQSGAWACFDEFNRIELEVLSVIAQQILTIVNAKRNRLKKFDFEGSTLTLNPDANSFITMNPGYAGRQELPDNLSALFRPCAMMVPDYALIAEIKLFSFGFADARTMARKLTQVLVLCSEQLSSQKHYDYGMRAVFSILVRAGKLRQMLGDQWTEPMIVLSAVTDVNLPKFNTNDIPLFKGITSDLFPGVQLPQNDYSDLIRSINEACKENNLETTESFMRAVIQLYETVLVRHGLMVVGEPFAGKSCVINVLQCGLTKTASEMSVESYFMNPKSITQGQLYGSFDENTHEWTDGVLAVTYRNAAKKTQEEILKRQWVVFDGPVDAVWIEDMNTVLDDNKKLCLQSGEIIKMSAEMTMMFEAEDLNEASPATVSRVGMVFLEQKRLGWNPLVIAWTKVLPETLEGGELFEDLFNVFFDPSVFCLRKYCKIPVSVTDSELCNNMLRIIKSLVVEVFPDQVTKSYKPPKDVPKILRGAFLFALIWAVGGVTEKEGRENLNSFWNVLFNGNFESNKIFNDFKSKNPGFSSENLKIMVEEFNSKPSFEEKGCFSFIFQIEKCNWIDANEVTPKVKIEENPLFTSIVVPTSDSFLNSTIVSKLLRQQYGVICTGSTGTGKSVVLQKVLIESMQNYLYMFVNFSAQTKAQQVQNLIDDKLEKRKRGIYGPPVGKKYLIFVDDLNLPQKETYGAQPPIEILRQMIDGGGFYDLKEILFKKMVDCIFLGAMGPPGGGNTVITQRMVRHFNVLNFLPFSDDSLLSVFSTILGHYFKLFPPGIKGVLGDLIKLTISVYKVVMENMLPTPTRSHYTFNLRDIGKIYQGVVRADRGFVKDTLDLLRIWGHEASRVFHDRLVNNTDRRWFLDLLGNKIKEYFKKDWKNLCPANAVLLFADFQDPTQLLENRIYYQVENVSEFGSVVEGFLQDYNNMSKQPMNLVLFTTAIEHISRICRVLNFEFGNMLLVGVGGSGRKSLTSLSVFIAEQTLFTIEITKSYGVFEWREDLKKLLISAGAENKKSCFLFADTQIVTETFVEDINNILNTGQVPNLFNLEETFAVIESARSLADKEGLSLYTTNEIMQYFVQKCRVNVHVILAFSPVGASFRNRLRQFPSLINCCVIDWFLEWPESALKSVAKTFLKDFEVENSIKEGVVNICVNMQTKTSSISKRFYDELRRYYYVTPTSYLELIKTFRSLINQKQTELENKKKRYENGLMKLRETAQQVQEMQEELEALQPKLVIAQKETNQKLASVKEKQVEADEQKLVVEQDEKVAKAQADSCEKDKKECEAILSQALPVLEAAVKALKTLNKNDITEIKAMKKPPNGVKLTLEAICLMLGVKPKKVPNPNGKGKVDDYWENAQKFLLGDPKFLIRLMDFDKENIADKVVLVVSKYLKMNEFQPDVIKKSSNAAAGLCKWVHAIIQYDSVAKVVRPKREALEKANTELNEALSLLKQKQEDLQEVLDNVARLTQELNETIAKKDQLENQVKDCSLKLDRAQRLINGLGGEKARWTQFTEDLAIALENSVGDVLISSGIIAYLGCFTTDYRNSCIKDWRVLLEEFNIRVSGNFSLAEVLGDPVKIRHYVLNKLPNDEFSIDNSIILFSSNRFPLMIDPQGQANKWIKSLEEELIVVKPNQNDFVRCLERGLSSGSAVLIENISENLDPLLDPILTKQIMTKGGQKTIQLGDNVIDYVETFRLYMTTKLSNPHYSPEVCVKVNLLNFMATVNGLFDQMLNITVKNETPALEQTREELVLQEANNKRVLKEIEDKILYLLAASEGNILDDEVLINTLSESKVTSDKIYEDLKQSEKTKIKLNKTRDSFKPVATRSSNLFFCVADLANIDPMYQFSLDWYTQLFGLAFIRAEPNASVKTRLKNLNETFSKILYDNVCRSLFEKDKLLFSFLLCVKTLQIENDIDSTELRYFLTGNTDVNLSRANPTGWLGDKSWADLLGMENMDIFDEFVSEFLDEESWWKEVFYSQDPKKMIQEKFEFRFSYFQRLLLLKFIRPDKVISGVIDFIIFKIGDYFVTPPTFNLAKCYEDSSCTIATLFILTPGADPMNDLIALAKSLGFQDKLIGVSLGQGQEKIASSNISLAVDKGYWVILQNCHVAKSYLPVLDKTIEEFNADVIHENFRLFLTALPLAEFPVNILQNGIKITIEPPKGIRNNLITNYKNLDEKWFNSCEKLPEFKKLCFGICFFHALVRERLSFGALGFNNKYTFSIPDLQITLDQLHLFLNEYETIPFKMLRYLAGECNYGGRVTDDKDRRCLLTILEDYYTPDILLDGYLFSPSDTYYAPKEGNITNYLDYIYALPLIDPPQIFGFHENAEITSSIKETNALLGKVLELQPKSASGGGNSFEEVVVGLIDTIEKQLPSVFDLERICIIFPIRFDESMNTVLVQELARFNTLVSVVKESLINLRKAISGTVVMSLELELMSRSMFNSMVPDLWKKYGYPSLKPLGTWVADLIQRVAFFQQWVDNATKPVKYWISAFFFIPGFLTGTRQNFARKYTIPIDLIKYDFKILKENEELTMPENGANIYGLFLEGANYIEHLIESTPKELFVSMPVIQLTPVDIGKEEILKMLKEKTEKSYECPIYKTSDRFGILSTTGHSTNFVMFMNVPMKEGDRKNHWVKRGVAMLTLLDT
eukprot:snap_masked-scaffold_23-processed-gene-1.31-mRNA-1 protein AED:0.10 eAED:0.11 QI:0/-1/0/1/-1/1/1/0/4309